MRRALFAIACNGSGAQHLIRVLVHLDARVDGIRKSRARSSQTVGVLVEYHVTRVLNELQNVSTQP
jgi:hypothetical protein